jgi:hypothetical protein
VQVVRADDVGRALAPDPRTESIPSAAAEPTPCPIVQVEWHDAWFDLDEPGPAERRSAYPVRTVGYLVGEGPSVLSVAQEVLPDGEGFRAVTHIPLPVVVGVVRLQATAP